MAIWNIVSDISKVSCVSRWASERTCNPSALPSSLPSPGIYGIVIIDGRFVLGLLALVIFVLLHHAVGDFAPAAMLRLYAIARESISELLIPLD